MSAPPPPNQPPDIPGIPDPLGLIAAAVPLGIVVGVLVVTAAVFGVTALRDQAPPMAPGAALQNSPATWLLFGGTLAGILLAGVATWIALSPITNWYRRAMFATVSGFATVVAMLLTTPVHAYFGRTGLVALAALCLAGIALLTRRLGRITRAGR